MHRAEVWQESVLVACVEGNDPAAVAKEIMRYALQYAEEGPVIVKFPSMSAKIFKKASGLMNILPNG